VSAACRSSMATPSRYVLPDNIDVREYDIHLKPSFDTFRFQGESKISLAVTKPTKVIKLHAKELAIDPKVRHSA
ncbi:hypothetical protein FOZ62_013126, partial [Perkinsus olseni]